MFLQVFLLALCIWTVLVLGVVLALLAVPCTIVIVSTLTTISWCYFWYKVITFVASFVHYLPLQYIIAQCKYMTDVTPPFTQLIRYWRMLCRRGVLEFCRFYLCRTASFIGETVISLVQLGTSQHKLHVTLIKYSIQVLLWPLVMLVKGVILLRHWSLLVTNWLISDVSKLLSTLIAWSNYLFGTQYNSYCLRSTIVKAWKRSHGIPYAFFDTFIHTTRALLRLPHLVWSWLVSFVLPEDIKSKEPSEITLFIVKNIPVLGRFSIVQDVTQHSMAYLSKVSTGMTSLKDQVVNEVYCRCHVTVTKVYSFVDCYVSIPGDVVLLFVRDTFVARPTRWAAKWIQENVQFPDIVQMTANHALQDIHCPYQQLSSKGNGKKRSKHRLSRQCKRLKHF